MGNINIKSNPLGSLSNVKSSVQTGKSSKIISSNFSPKQIPNLEVWIDPEKNNTSEWFPPIDLYLMDENGIYPDVLGVYIDSLGDGQTYYQDGGPSFISFFDNYEGWLLYSDSVGDYIAYTNNIEYEGWQEYGGSGASIITTSTDYNYSFSTPYTQWSFTNLAKTNDYFYNTCTINNFSVLQYNGTNKKFIKITSNLDSRLTSYNSYPNTNYTMFIVLRPLGSETGIKTLFSTDEKLSIYPQIYSLLSQISYIPIKFMKTVYSTLTIDMEYAYQESLSPQALLYLYSKPIILCITRKFRNDLGNYYYFREYYMRKPSCSIPRDSWRNAPGTIFSSSRRGA